MKYGFIIDNRKCIGCHACSTACKSENDVPIGVHRTWVKYTETGQYPDTSRHFQVTRCNHCENAPCVRICPTSAMYQRDNGIVEFDKDACIGCKACIQACPYDAIHIDPSSSTASKCHFCSHRVDVGLEPACVVVCPEHAIIAGDMDDPDSEISHMLAKENVTVRKPEQGTAPKLFYIDGHDASMIPTATTEGDQFMWSENKPHKPQSETPRPKAKSGLSSQGAPRHGNYARGGTVAEQMVQVGYNVWHKEYWHWQVPAYIVTKDIAAGLFLMVSTLLLLGFDPGMDLHKIALVSLGFTIITTAFLVLDLEKPLRFLYILFRPQWRSWLTRGAFVLIGFSLVQTLWVGIELAAVFWSEGLELTSWRDPLLGWGIPLAVLTAIYTAFLFGQAEGRDLWQHPLLPIQLLVRTLLAGSAVVLLMGAQEWHHNANLQLVASVFFPVTVLINLFMVLIGEVAMPHASNVAAAAAKDIIKGRYKYWFWIGGIGIGSILPLAIGTFSSSPLVVSTAAISALVGIFILEYLFVMAPQRVPNS